MITALVPGIKCESIRYREPEIKRLLINDNSDSERKRVVGVVYVNGR